MAPDDVFIINQGLEMRSSKSGKTRFTVRVVSEPIAIQTDPALLAMKPAKAMAAYLRQQVQAIAATVAPATMKYRQSALAAFVRGKPWAMARYSGGRTGSKPPLRHGEEAFNDSGRFAGSITATQSKSDKTWRINVAANRLSDAASGGFERLWNRLVSLVPAFGDPMKDGIVEEGIRWSVQNMIKKQAATSSKLTLERIKAGFEVFQQLMELADDVAGIAA